MLEFLEYVVVRLILAIIPTAIWTVASIVIMAVLHVITKENISDEHFDNYTIITNYILLSLKILSPFIASLVLLKTIIKYFIKIPPYILLTYIVYIIYYKCKIPLEFYIKNITLTLYKLKIKI